MPSPSTPLSQHLHTFTTQKLHLILITTLWGRYSYYSYFSRWEPWGIEVSRLAQGHSVVSVRAGIWTCVTKLHVRSWPLHYAASHAIVEGGASSLEPGGPGMNSIQLYLPCDFGKVTLTSSFFLWKMRIMHLAFCIHVACIRWDWALPTPSLLSSHHASWRRVCLHQVLRIL